MFCPPGYVLIEDLSTRLLERSFDILPDRPMEAGEDDEAYFEDCFSRRESNAFFATVDFLMDCGSTSVSSPAGGILKISKEILTRQYPGVNQVHSNQPQVLRYLRTFDWIVDTRRARAFEDAFAHDEPKWPPAEIEETERQVALSEWTAWHLAAAGRPRTAAIANFEGWALTLLEDDAPRDPAAFDQYLTGERWGALDESHSPARRGRPSKQAKALAAFRKHFPSGRDGCYWDQVLDVVSREIGEPVSKDTLQRAIKRVGAASDDA